MQFQQGFPFNSFVGAGRNPDNQTTIKQHYLVGLKQLACNFLGGHLIYIALMANIAICQCRKMALADFVTVFVCHFSSISVNSKFIFYVYNSILDFRWKVLESDFEWKCLLFVLKITLLFTNEIILNFHFSSDHL